MATPDSTHDAAIDLLLSFDDGPHPAYTAKLLDLLALHKVHAVFFVLGKKLRQRDGQALLLRMVREGHFVGNHTFTHPDMTKLTERQIKDELNRTADLIGDADRGVKLFRPPYGAHNSLVDQVVADLGYRTLFWTTDSRDWVPSFRANEWVEEVVSQIQARRQSVILAHDTCPSTVSKIEDLLNSTAKRPHVRLSLSSSLIEQHLTSTPALWGVGPSRLLTTRCKVQNLYHAVMSLSWTT